jgi:hypothetical protein
MVVGDRKGLAIRSTGKAHRYLHKSASIPWEAEKSRESETVSAGVRPCRTIGFSAIHPAISDM